MEIGPVTAFAPATFDVLLPFPAGLQMGWGLDAHWSAVAAEHGWPIGIVDATPVGHTLRPAAATYPRDEAIAEARGLPRRAAVRDARRGANAAGAPVKALVVAEFYPRADDPVLGIWAHEQARAAQAAGADVHVVVLHRIVPPAATPRLKRPGAALALARHPRRLELDGIPVDLRALRLAAEGRAYGRWGAWAAPSLWRALRRLRREFPFDLVHAHNAVPAADAVLRAGVRTPLVISEHGADVFHTAVQPSPTGAPRSSARSAQPGSCSPTATGSPARRRSSARSAPASCTWAPTCPPRPRTTADPRRS